MATDDQQIKVAGIASVPADALIPGNGQIKPKVMRAVYDGTGASGDFLPVLQVISDGGVLIGEYVGTKIVAGASASVSWFPHVAAPAVAAASGAEWCWLGRNTSLTITAASDTVIPWTTFKTSNASVFSLTNANGTSTTINVAKPGITLMSIQINPTSPAAYQLGILGDGDNEIPFGSAAANWLTDSNATATPAGNNNNPRDYRISVGTASPFDLFAVAHNYSGVNHTLASCRAGVIYWPNTVLWA